MIQEMYGGCTTSARTLIGSTESFEVKVGLHQGSALSPLLSIIIMDVISQEVGRGPPHAIIFIYLFSFIYNVHVGERA